MKNTRMIRKARNIWSKINKKK